MNPELVSTFLGWLQRRPEKDALRPWVDDGIAMLTDDEWATFEAAFRKKRKDPAACWALWGILGVFGAHRFFLGHTAMGFLYLVTLGLLGLGVLADLFNMGEVIQAYNTRVQADIVADLINARLQKHSETVAASSAGPAEPSPAGA